MLGDATFVGFVPVRDLAEARSFYCDVLGLRAVEETPVAVVVDAGGVRVRLTEVADLRPQPFTVAGWVVPDVDGTVMALARAGVEVLRYDGMGQDDRGVWTAPGGDRVAWFRDPDGNVLSVTGPRRS